MSTNLTMKYNLRELRNLFARTIEVEDVIEKINLPRQSFLEIVRMSDDSDDLMAQLFAWFEVTREEVI